MNAWDALLDMAADVVFGAPAAPAAPAVVRMCERCHVQPGIHRDDDMPDWYFCSEQCQNSQWHYRETVFTPIFSELLGCVFDGEADRCREILQEGIVTVDTKSYGDGEGCSLVGAAAQEGQLEVLKVLFDFPGADANSSTDVYHMTPTFMAAKNNHGHCIAYLAGRGAHLDVQGAGGYNPLMIAAELANDAAIDALIAAGANVNYSAIRTAQVAADVEGVTAFYAAAEAGNISSLRRLFHAGANVDQAAAHGANALIIACSNSQVAAVRVMLSELGVDVNFRQVVPPNNRHIANDGSTALFHACGVPACLELVSALVAAGANVNAVKASGASVLLTAVASGPPVHRPALVRLLVASGADVNQPIVLNGIGGMTLHALLAGHFVGGSTALMLASGQFANAAVVEVLLELGADPEARSANGATALGLAREFRAGAHITALLEASLAKLALLRLRELRWQRRRSFVHALVGSGLRLMNDARLAQELHRAATLDPAAEIPPIPIDTPAKYHTHLCSLVLGSDEISHRIASFL